MQSVTAVVAVMSIHLFASTLAFTRAEYQAKTPIFRMYEATEKSATDDGSSEVLSHPKTVIALDDSDLPAEENQFDSSAVNIIGVDHEKNHSQLPADIAHFPTGPDDEHSTGVHRDQEENHGRKDTSALNNSEENLVIRRNRKNHFSASQNSVDESSCTSDQEVAEKTPIENVMNLRLSTPPLEAGGKNPSEEKSNDGSGSDIDVDGSFDVPEIHNETGTPNENASVPADEIQDEKKMKYQQIIPSSPNEMRSGESVLQYKFRIVWETVSKQVRARPIEKVSCEFFECDKMFRETRPYRKLHGMLLHVLGHVTDLPYFCETCDENTGLPFFHNAKFHSSNRRPPKTQIRDEIVDEAIAKVKRCYSSLLATGARLNDDQDPGSGGDPENLRSEPEVQDGNEEFQANNQDRIVSVEALCSSASPERFDRFVKSFTAKMNDQFQDRIQKIVVPCEDRSIEFRRGKATKNLLDHISEHLDEPLFHCSRCEKHISDPMEHFEAFHDEENPLTVEETLIRVDLAEVATVTLIKCFPSMKWEEVAQKFSVKDELNIYEQAMDENQEIAWKSDLPLEETSLEKQRVIRYKYLVLSAANHMKLRFGAGKKLELPCKLCPSGTWTSGDILTPSLFLHLLSHVDEIPFFCEICSRNIFGLKKHYRRFHSALKGTTIDRYTIREDLAKDALEKFSLCLPDLSYLGWLSTEQLYSIADPAYYKKVDSFEELSGAELEEALKCLEKFPLLIQAVAEHLREYHAAGKALSCKKCGKKCFQPPSQRSVASHTIRHVKASPYRCLICHELVKFLSGHFIYCHPFLWKNFFSQFTTGVRPELMGEVIKNLFECYPEFKWLKDMDKEEIKEHIKSVNYSNENPPKKFKVRTASSKSLSLSLNVKEEPESKPIAKTPRRKRKSDTVDEAIEAVRRRVEKWNESRSGKREVQSQDFKPQKMPDLADLKDEVPELHIKPPSMTVDEFWKRSAVIGEQMRTALNAGVAACTRCSLIDTWAGKKRSPFEFVAHAISHMRVKPFYCERCKTYVRSAKGHNFSVHNLPKTIRSTKHCLRPEVVDLAMEVLYECYPECRFDMSLKTEKVDHEENE